MIVIVFGSFILDLLRVSKDKYLVVEIPYYASGLRFRIHIQPILDLQQPMNELISTGLANMRACFHSSEFIDEHLLV